MNTIVNWQETKHRFEAFWAYEPLDRCLIAITSPKLGAQHISSVPVVSLEDRWTNKQYLYDRFMSGLNNTVFSGESLPVYWPNFGPGVLAAFMGSNHVFSQSTVWMEPNPSIRNIGDVLNLKVNEENGLYPIVAEVMSYLAERANGQYIVAMTDLGGGLDIAISLLGTSIMMMKLYDEPEMINALLEVIDCKWIESFKKLNQLISPYQQGSSSWLSLWHPGKMYPLQCDACVMISPNMFERYVIPSLHRQAAILDAPIYHLDGDGELVHLDMLLSIGSIKAIEWIPVKYPVDDPIYFPMLQKIQHAGKRLILRSVRAEKLQALIENLDSAGLYITMNAETPQKCEEILKLAVKWRRKSKLPN